MHCEEVLHLISGHLDSCNSETEEIALQEHLQRCRECRELLTQMEQNDQLLSCMVEPPAELSTRIMDAVRKEPRKARRKRWYTSLTAAGLATAALLALVFFGSTGLPAMEADNASMEMACEPLAEGASGETLCRADDGLQNEDLSGGATSYGYTIEDGDTLYFTTPSAQPAESEDSAADQSYETTESFTLHAAESNGQPFPGDMPVRKGTADAYGLISADGSLQEIPTLIIRDADIADFPGLKYLPMDTEAQAMPLASDFEADFYERYLSCLPTEYSLLGSGTLRNTPQFSLSRYSLSYSSFITLLEAAAGKYELSVYLPADLAEAETCLVIFVCSEE